MAKKEQNALGIFTEATGLYFSNFIEFFKYMSFPVLGQVLGLVIIFITTYFYSQKMPIIISKYPEFANFSFLLTITILVILPGLAILTKALWEYIVAYGAINSMFDNMKKSGRVYDFEAHTELVKRRTFSFVGLWLIIGLLSILAICPLAIIVAVYFTLVFQVFIFEPELSPFGCIKKSFSLIKGHLLLTSTLLVLSILVTYCFIPQLFTKIFEYVGLNNVLRDCILPLVSLFTIPSLEQYGVQLPSHIEIAKSLIEILIAQVIIQYTLPLRSIMCSILYKNLAKKTTIVKETKTRKKYTTKKRPSEKLMESSHKKYGTKKLDRNLMRRAYEKDYED